MVDSGRFGKSSPRKRSASFARNQEEVNHRDTKTQRREDRENHRDTKTQRREDRQPQRHKDTEKIEPIGLSVAVVKLPKNLRGSTWN